MLQYLISSRPPLRIVLQHPPQQIEGLFTRMGYQTRQAPPLALRKLVIPPLCEALPIRPVRLRRSPKEGANASHLV